MDKLYIVYWTSSGNTEEMASHIADGVRKAGKEPEIVQVSKIDPDTLKDQSAFALGCSAMGAEELDEDEMEPFVESVEKFSAGKTIGLFGSYGWGDGEWMRTWVKRMQDAGAVIPDGRGVIAQESPDKEAVDECEALGKALAAV